MYDLSAASCLMVSEPLCSVFQTNVSLLLSSLSLAFNFFSQSSKFFTGEMLFTPGGCISVTVTTSCVFCVAFPTFLVYWLVTFGGFCFQGVLLLAS